jgi:3-hydroxy-9,10-secoandrosta-1,3,5(10)-triene-9,17-dione monooxygenase
MLSDLVNDFLRGDFSRSGYVRQARELVPVLRERAAEQWKHPSVFAETVADLQACGFFQMLQPKRWGGGETTPIESFEVASVLAEGDPSVAWVLGVVGIHAYHLAFFDDRAQEEVWGHDVKTLVSSPYAPGKARRVDGGFVLSGRWAFSSGGEHCRWTFLGANVEGEENSKAATSASMAQYTFLLPREDYQIVPNWEVHGLRATGSHDIVVENAFVPTHRTLTWESVLTGDAPGLARNTGPLYRVPFFQIFSRATQAPAALGALRGLVRAFIDFNSGRISRRGTTMGQNPEGNLVVAEALSHAEEMKSQVYKNYARVIAELDGAGPRVSIDDRRQFRFQSAQIPPRCARIASELYRICGGNAIYEHHPFGRLLNDIMAIQTHQINNYQLHANAWAGTLLGCKAAADNHHA